MCTVLYSALWRHSEEDWNMHGPQGHTYVLMLWREITQLTVTVQRRDSIGDSHSRRHLAAWEDAEMLWYVLNLRCWKDNQTQLPTRHLEMWTEVEEIETEECAHLTRREWRRREETYNQKLPSWRWLLKIEEVDGYGRMRGKGGKWSLGILGDWRDRVGKVNSKRNRNVSSRRDSEYSVFFQIKNWEHFARPA